MFSIAYVDEIRAFEITQVASHFPQGACVLEIGAGTGRQARDLQQRGFAVSAVDLKGSRYSDNRVFTVVEYDGVTLPFADASFDVVFSSNVLEHVRDLSALYHEMRRVLKPGGYCIHVMPTHTWRLWTALTSFPTAAQWCWRALIGRAPLRTAIRQCGAALLQPRHGVRGFGYGELWLFRPQWWRRNFIAGGFTIASDEPMNLFYTGNLLFGPHLGFSARQRLAAWLGSSSHLFKLRATTARDPFPTRECLGPVG